MFIKRSKTLLIFGVLQLHPIMNTKQQIEGIDGSSSHLEQEFSAHEDKKVSQQKNPTPHERADLIVRRLENFIREGRTEDGGINFRKWR